MDIRAFMKRDGEKPLDNIVTNGGLCGIFRKIACIGDSLSSGEFESFECDKRGYHDFYEYSWGQYMARDIGCTVYNFSKGGMTARDYNSFAKSKDFYNDEYKAQAYIIALGANDISSTLRGEMEFGDENDVDLSDFAKNKPTFAGYYGQIVSRYKEISPDAKFFFVTFPNDKLHKGGEIIPGMVELLYSLAELFDNAYVIDLYKYGPVYDQRFKDRFYLLGHLNPDGYILTAQLIDSYIDYIVRHNPDDFRHAGFILTDIDYKQGGEI